MATLTATPSLDGFVDKLFQASWAAARDAATGDNVDKTSVTASLRAEEPAGGTFHVSRMFMVFSLASLPAGTIINSATLSVFASSISAGSNNAKTLNLVSSTQASQTDLVLADFDQRGSTAFASEFVAAAGANTFTLNASGITQLTNALGGNVMFAIIMKYDFDNTDPPVEDGRLSLDTVESATESQRPTLTIQYTSGNRGYSFII